MKSRVSIVIPAYNAASLIGETLESVRSQLFTEWELIVVEDGSSDGTDQIVQDFAQSVRQSVRLIRHEKNKGLPSTRNTGIAHAQGQWVALLDADDLWKPRHLQQLISTVSEAEAGMAYAGSLLFEGSPDNVTSERIPSAEDLKEHPLSLYLAHYAIQPSSVLIEKSWLDRTGGFDPDIKYCEDRDMWLRLAEAGSKFAYTGSSTCLYRKHAGAMTKQSATMAYYNAVVLEKHQRIELAPRRHRARVIASAWESAARLSYRDDPGAALIYIKKSLSHRPSYLAAALYLKLTLFRRKSVSESKDQLLRPPSIHHDGAMKESQRANRTAREH